MQFRTLSLATLGAVSLALSAALTVALPAWAHHSHANYDVSQFTNIEGTVKETRWMNPHTWIYLEIKDDKGQTAVWTLEGGSPAALARGGWKKEDIKVGDTIKVRCHRLKDASNGCLLGFITTKTIPDKEYD